MSNSSNQTDEQLEAWIKYVSLVPTTDFNDIKSTSIEDTTHAKIYEYFKEWFEKNHYVDKNELVSCAEGALLGILPNYYIQMQEILQDGSPGKMIMFCFYKIFWKGFDHSEMGENWKDDVFRGHEGFGLFEKKAQTTSIFYIYAPETQDCPAISGQYLRDAGSIKIEIKSKISDQKLSFRAVILQAVNKDDKIGREFDKLRFERGDRLWGRVESMILEHPHDDLDEPPPREDSD